MTNAEKYLKDGVDVDELVKELEDYIDKKYKEEYEWFHSVPLFRYLNDFFNIDLNKPIKPTLTEDERVILRNLNKEEFTHIGRHKLGDLFLKYKAGTILNEYNFECYTNLFQFIKERRRIRNKGVTI